MLEILARWAEKSEVGSRLILFLFLGTTIIREVISFNIIKPAVVALRKTEIIGVIFNTSVIRVFIGLFPIIILLEIYSYFVTRYYIKNELTKIETEKIIKLETSDILEEINLKFKDLLINVLNLMNLIMLFVIFRVILNDFKLFNFYMFIYFSLAAILYFVMYFIQRSLNKRYKNIKHRFMCEIIFNTLPLSLLYNNKN